MPVFTEPDKPYHLTCVVNQLLPIFSQPQIVRIVMDSWLYQRRHNGMQLYGYVIMEEHLHFLARAEHLDHCLDEFMGQSEKLIQEYLVENNLERFLLRLTGDLSGTGQEFKLWQVPPEREAITDDAMFYRTLDYIHINPVKRGYVDRAENWRYSSAGNYAGGGGVIEIDIWE